MSVSIYAVLRDIRQRKTGNECSELITASGRERGERVQQIISEMNKFGSLEDENIVKYSASSSGSRKMHFA